MNLDCLGNPFDFEVLVGTWFQCTMEVSLIVVVAPESQMMEETDSLGISSLRLEGTMRAALRGEGMGGMEMMLLPLRRNFLKRHTAWYKVGVSQGL